ncbi:glycosyl transferase [Lasius niger]|uniref:Glycosyl transferase n=1 Tax=Lasius niger TaxID=67767 RepID=A0A0J7KCV5_LASNI|nr:glycosyl transferase [Lasius niger]
MIPAAEEATFEEIAEMPEASQAQEYPKMDPVEHNPDEHNPDGHNPDEQIPDEQNPDEHREEDAQLNEEDTGEQSVKEGQQQTPPVNLKYIL